VTVNLYISEAWYGLARDSAQAGVTFVRQGGHRRLHAFFRAHPEQLDGRFTKTPEYERGGHAYTGGGFAGTQHAARAGTVCLWHGWCPHQASANASAQPRLAIISRWADRRFTCPSINFGFGAEVGPGLGRIVSEKAAPTLLVNS
jgi:ectoine hydroxylase-related dioxygenase (phytanoyl-CoA dioxygenase family)